MPDRYSLGAERIEWLLGCVRDELTSATTKHAPMHSGHEGYAVILEELDDLWAHVKADTGHGTAAMEEAIQIAAMALRYVHDLAEWGPGVELLPRRVPARSMSRCTCFSRDTMTAACPVHGANVVTS